MWKAIVVIVISVGLVKVRANEEDDKVDGYLDTVAPEHHVSVVEALTCILNKGIKACQDDRRCQGTNDSITELFKGVTEFPVVNVYTLFAVLLHTWEGEKYKFEECLDESSDKYLVAMGNLIQRINDSIGDEVKVSNNAPLNIFKGWKSNCPNLLLFKKPCLTVSNTNSLDTDLAAASYIADSINPGTACRLGLEGGLNNQIFEKNANRQFQATVGCTDNYDFYITIMKSFY